VAPLEWATHSSSRIKTKKTGTAKAMGFISALYA
jgi:hypothetical protein